MVLSRSVNEPQLDWLLKQFSFSRRYGTVQHGMLHAMGFYHEQSRTARDGYVDILFDNILEGQDFGWSG